MTRIILIKGPTDSHKTTTALEFTSKFVTAITYIGSGPGASGAILSALPPMPIGTGRPKDFVAVGSYSTNGETLKIGVASAGDGANQINGHLSYFVTLNLDIILICCKNSGSSVDRVMHHLYDPAGLFYKSTLNVTSKFKFPRGNPLISDDRARAIGDIIRYIG
ncbi:hypothetical protein [Novosphingobium humi]|uniref:hypothetical protein n=1 Tax=Novosphingobium humi TaxID=2282397 RepID=UPI0025AF108C|nr:hypothetical protein [Novosphingobium humi]WJS97821.1 hypothetical protein NYQ05_11825 [Novosphingobium humi]